MKAFKVQYVMVLLFSFLSITTTLAQTDIPARYPGGDDAYYQLMDEHLAYPASALESQSDRTVKVILVIEVDGSVRIQEFVYENSGLGFEEEVTSFISKMPNWESAIYNNVVSASQVILTFDFKYTREQPGVTETFQLEYYEDSDIPPFFEYGHDSLIRAINFMLMDSLKLKTEGGTCSFECIIDTLGRLLNMSILENKSDISDRYWMFALQSIRGWVPGLRNGVRANVHSTYTVSAGRD